MTDDDKAEMYAIRKCLDEHPVIATALVAMDRHILAEQLADAAWAATNARGESSRRVVFDSNGNPQCSWCGRMGCNEGTTPTMPRTHPQYGLFCTCTAPRLAAEVI